MKRAALLISLILFFSFTVSAANDSSSYSGFLSNIPDIHIEDSQNGQFSEGGPSFNFYWIIVLGIVTALIVIYSFEIDPIYIVAAVGVSMAIYLLFRLGLVSV